MKPRALKQVLDRALKTFPAIVLTGPRQSGKTTLLRSLFSKTHRFVSLENPDIRLRAKEDPNGFLEDHPAPLILDEIQYCPELLSFLKTRIDEHRKPGQYLITGSQNFILMQGVTQSLAGRAAILFLLPFSLMERLGYGDVAKDAEGWMRILDHAGESYVCKTPLETLILRGSYPEIAIQNKVDRKLWCSSYISTYLERDVRNLAQIGDLNVFERFLRLCAVLTGQILNMSEFSRDLGISVPTVKRWLSILEASHQVYLLYPYYRNIGKRLVKAPKLYFTDTALASYLLGLHEKETLTNSPHFGHLFETFIVIDILKRFYHSGETKPPLYYLRTRDGLEIDLVVEFRERLHCFEIKSSMTVVPKFADPIRKALGDLTEGVGQSVIVSRGKETFGVGPKIIHKNWRVMLAC